MTATTIGFLHDISLLSDNTVAVFGAEDASLNEIGRSLFRDWRLQMYNFVKGTQMDCINLHERLVGVAVVKLAGYHRLAVAYS